jgi:hypothetical protein
MSAQNIARRIIGDVILVLCLAVGIAWLYEDVSETWLILLIVASVILVQCSRTLRHEFQYFWEAPVGILVPILAVIVIWRAPQMPDMVAGLLNGRHVYLAVGLFWGSAALLGITGWYWTRAILGAKYALLTVEDRTDRFHNPEFNTRREAVVRNFLGPSDLAELVWAERTPVLVAMLAAVLIVSMSAPSLKMGIAHAVGFIVFIGIIGVFWFVVQVFALRREKRRRGSRSERSERLERLHAYALARPGTFSDWFRFIPRYVNVVLFAAPGGRFLSVSFLVVNVLALFVIATWDGNSTAYPASPTVALLALALVIPPLCLALGALLQMPVFQPHTVSLLIGAVMIFVVTWNPPSLYSVRLLDNHAERPDLATALRTWRHACLRDWPEKDAAPAEEAPVIIVAAEGGASRGAIWLLSAMRELDRRTDGAFGQHVFAISGVSGGSLGAATYLALRQAHAAVDPKNPCKSALRVRGEDKVDPLTEMASRDFLAPVIATYFYTDVLRRTLPFAPFMAPFGRDLPDRALALELAFEQYWTDVAKTGNGSGILSLSAAATAPHLLLNGTDAKTGQRVITSTFRLDRNSFPNADDLLDIVGHDMPLSTAVTNSARFPFVSPAGRFSASSATASTETSYSWIFDNPLSGPCRLLEFLSRNGRYELCNTKIEHRQIIDGGYFENYGALTALELARAISALPDIKLKPIVVVVSNDAVVPQSELGSKAVYCEGEKGAVPPAKELNESQGSPTSGELGAIIGGYYATRGAHGLAALQALRRELCNSKENQNRLIHFALPKPDDKAKTRESAPMNWVLNEDARHFMVEVAPKIKFNQDQGNQLCKAALGMKECIE